MSLRCVPNTIFLDIIAQCGVGAIILFERLYLRSVLDFYD